jgi:hypothetical protein
MFPRPQTWPGTLQRDGYAIVPSVIDDRRIALLLSALQDLEKGPGVRTKRAKTYAVRNLMENVPEVRRLALSPEIRTSVVPVLGEGARAVRAILFDKTPEANWKVAWHQDLSIAVRARAEVPGYGPWSEKAGVVHVQPPAQVLENMVTVRLHLDDCGPENGPLQVLPGSHAHGVLSPPEIERWRASVEPVNCNVARGGVVLMRPLLLHASASATQPGHRRVIHLEYAAASLPAGLEWFEPNETIEPKDPKCNPP